MENNLNDNRFDPAYDLWMLLAETRHLLSRAREKELLGYDITAVQTAILLAIEAIGNEAKPADISRWIARKPHTVSEAISRMEKVGLVAKRKDLHKKNLVRVIITQKGKQARDNAIKRESIQRIMSILNEEEREILRSQLEKLIYRAQEELSNGKKPAFPEFYWYQ